MKKSGLIASTFLSLLAMTAAASAADMAPAAYDWSGMYLGLNAGAAWNNSEVDNNVDSTSGAPVSELEDTVDGDQTVFTGGAMMGYNWQYDSFVMGFETDFNYLGFESSRDRDFTVSGGGVDVSTNLDFQADWYGTLRARMGFAADNLLFYGTGGLAYGHLEASGKIDAYNGVQNAVWDGSVDDVNWGWTVGAGMEYAFDQNWIVGAEYMYVDLGSADFDYDNNGIDPGTNAEAHVDYQFSVARLTVKYKF